MASASTYMGKPAAAINEGIRVKGFLEGRLADLVGQACQGRSIVGKG